MARYTGPLVNDGGYLVRAPAAPPARRQPVEHVHLHLPVGAWPATPRLPQRRTTHDAVPLRHRVADLDPQPGALLCTVKQDGEGGDWTAEHSDPALPLAVTSGANGLEIRHGEPHAGPAGLRALSAVMAAHYRRRS